MIYAISDRLLLDLGADLARGVMESREPTQIITREELGDYLHRWMLVRKSVVPRLVENFVVDTGDGRNDPSLIPGEIENVFLHRYLRGDAEDLHCHPWPNATVVLKGRIVEQYNDVIMGVVAQRELESGDVVIRQGEDAHAIVDVEPGTITLFVTGRKEREWGFYPDGEFVHHSQYEGKTR